ncbi:MAG: J domain-containing protein [Deltaproteobacteria bacterium]|nr:J domain-containing protein [Deltaproteobacteria bacterium]MBW2340689.1 J domain-containing protein [Deltaproteobacteria bacterium]
MDIKRCFEILELRPEASIDEAKQAYKDMVNIWHPDRFLTNPRLEQKAEKKLKEINQAYETLSSFLSSKPGLKKEAETPTHAQAQARTQATASWAESKTKTEAAVETGTFGFLDLWSYLSTKLRQLIAEQVQAFKEGSQGEPWEINQRQGRGKGKGGGVGSGRGRGQGMGRGGGGGRSGWGSGGGRRRSR